MHGHEGFAVIWREAQRRRAELLGLWFSQIFNAEQSDEFPPPHGAYPKAKDHGLKV
jgi:hypothetical protein